MLQALSPEKCVSRQPATQVLHRRFFARAMLEEDYPFQCLYAPSVLATFASAISLLDMVAVAVRDVFQDVVQHHDMWFYVLSSVVSSSPTLQHEQVKVTARILPTKVVVASTACKIGPPAFAEAARTALAKAVETLEIANEHPMARDSLVSDAPSFNTKR